MVRLLYAVLVGIPVAGAAVGPPTVPEVTVTAPKPPAADTRKLTNFSVGSISDYIALLTLSRATSLDRCNQLPSIIDLMSPICGSASTSIAMTAGDIAYLRALYSLNMEQPLSLQRMDIQNKMMREFQKLSAE